MFIEWLPETPITTPNELCFFAFRLETDDPLRSGDRVRVQLVGFQRKVSDRAPDPRVEMGLSSGPQGDSSSHLDCTVGKEK